MFLRVSSVNEVGLRRDSSTRFYCCCHAKCVAVLTSDVRTKINRRLASSERLPVDNIILTYATIPSLWDPSGARPHTLTKSLHRLPSYSFTDQIVSLFISKKQKVLELEFMVAIYVKINKYIKQIVFVYQHNITTKSCSIMLLCMLHYRSKRNTYELHFIKL